MTALFRPRVALAAVAICLGLLSTGHAQTLPSGPQVLTFFSEVDDTDQPYAIYLPPAFDASAEYPLVISLHGAGSNHRLNLRRVFGKSNKPGENDVEASRYFPDWEGVNYIVASPYARGTMGYQTVAERDVMDVLADVKRRFSIDEDRIYLTGLSMGGGGTLWMGLTRPDVWAAIAAVCPAPPPTAQDYAPNALNLPVHLFQGADDTVVHPDSVRAWRDTLNALGTDVSYTEYPGVGHFSWENAYAKGQIFDWFDQHERTAHPDRVRFTTRRYKYNTAHWVRIDALTPGTQAQIDAAFTDTNRLEITTQALDGFTLYLTDHPQAKTGRPLSLSIDGHSLSVMAADTLSFHSTDDGWAAGRYDAPPLAKRQGQEGPMSEAVAARHVYVYGTADQPSDAELQRRREQAVTAANWSMYRGAFLRRVKVFPRVVADRNVRKSDLETSNLVLFGTRQSNQLIARFGDRLPLRVDTTATDYGLAYIFPRGSHYVLVSSGRPWWTAQAAHDRGAFGNQVPALRLMGLKDYLLFDADGRTIAEGRFTRQWHVPEADIAALESTGVVTVHSSR
jgi:poly(3-hydroxybutyrate) depolymerase